MPKKTTDHLICFDLDGTLISSVTIANQLFYDTVEEELNLSTTAFRSQKNLMALSAEERLATLWPEANLQSGQIKETLEVYRQKKMSAGIPILPGAKEAVALMAEHFEFMACVSNSPDELIEETLASLGLLHYFSKLTGINHVQFSKPHPEIYTSTVDYFGLKPEDCLTFEDSTTGVRSAKAAGMRVIGVTTGLESGEDLKKDGADVVLKGLDGLRFEMIMPLLNA